MKREKKGWFYIAAAVAGFVMAGYYAVELSPHSFSRFEWGRTEIAFAIVFGISLASFLNLLFGVAMVYGQVSRVSGSRESATMFVGSDVIRDKRILVAIRMNEEASDDGVRIVMFVAGFRPWICPADEFLK